MIKLIINYRIATLLHRFIDNVSYILAHDRRVKGSV
jgi:hypothetical protein